MTLFDLASNNHNLKFIDVKTEKEFLLRDLILVNFSNTEKKLIFAYLDNSIESISVFWSLMKSNHCIALVPPNLNENLKNELEGLYKPYFIFDFLRNEIEGYENLGNNKMSYFKAFSDSNIEINIKIKLLISTSGTTGSPKFVKLSEENLISNATSITKYLPIDEFDVTPLNLPIFYSYGLSILTSNSLKGGRIVCTNDDLLKKKFWDSFEKLGYTSFAGVPFIYEMLDRIGFTKKIYPTLKYFTQAGGKLQENLALKYGEYALSNRIHFFMMYGQTEATARMSYLEPSKVFEKIGSIGQPIPNGEFIIDETTNELCYNGENVFGGYVEKPSDLVDYFQQQILRTGDLAKVDKDGYYYITGRLKRFTKLFGNRINLDEVESIIAKHLNLIVKCIGLNDKTLIIFTTDSNIDLKEISQFVSTEIKIHISAIKSIHINEYPLTNNGKINYIELTKLYGIK